MLRVQFLVQFFGCARWRSAAPTRPTLRCPVHVCLRVRATGYAGKFVQVDRGRPVRTEGGLLNNIHIAIAEGDAIIREIEAQLANEKAKLEALGVRVVSVLKPNAKKDHHTSIFPKSRSTRRIRFAATCVQCSTPCWSCPDCRQTSIWSVFLRSAATLKSTLVLGAWNGRRAPLRHKLCSFGPFLTARDLSAKLELASSTHEGWMNWNVPSPTRRLFSSPRRQSSSSRFTGYCRRTCCPIQRHHQFSEESIGRSPLEVEN
jgi:hypothetical protein